MAYLPPCRREIKDINNLAPSNATKNKPIKKGEKETRIGTIILKLLIIKFLTLDVSKYAGFYWIPPQSSKIVLQPTNTLNSN